METGIEELDTDAANNDPGNTGNVSNGDDEIRGTKALLRQSLTKGSDIASASTITPASTGSSFDVTGTTTITAIGSTNSWNGRRVLLQFDGVCQLTHSSTLKLPNAQNITTVAGDVAEFWQESSGTWRCSYFQRATMPRFRARLSSSDSSGTSLTMSKVDFDAESIDVGSWFSGGTATAPRKGAVWVSFTLTFDFDANSTSVIYLQANLYQGGSAVTGARVSQMKGSVAVTGGTKASVSWAGPVDVNASDTLEVYCAVNDTTQPATLLANECTFSAFYLD